MKAIILTADGVEDSEFFYPYYRLLEAGFEVDVAAPKAGKVQGKMGYSFEASMSFADVNSENYDLLCLPGGKGPEKVRLDEHALEVARQMMNSGKIVCAICHGPQVLISAGLVKDRHATCWAGVKDDLIAAGARFSDKEVVVDDNLITSRMPDDLPAFCREIFSLVREKEPVGI